MATVPAPKRGDIWLVFVELPATTANGLSKDSGTDAFPTNDQLSAEVATRSGFLK